MAARAWASNAGAAFSKSAFVDKLVDLCGAAERIETHLAAAGREMEANFTREEAEGLKKEFGAKVKAAGGGADLAYKWWARIIYKYAWPGSSSCDGHFWKRAADGSIAIGLPLPRIGDSGEPAASALVHVDAGARAWRVSRA